jgi:hypothetical protein
VCRRIRARADPGRLGDVEQEHEVEIGDVTELLAAELAVADDREGGGAGIRTGEVAPAGVERGVEDDVRERR